MSFIYFLKKISGEFSHLVLVVCAGVEGFMFSSVCGELGMIVPIRWLRPFVHSVCVAVVSTCSGLIFLKLYDIIGYHNSWQRGIHCWAGTED